MSVSHEDISRGAVDTITRLASGMATFGMKAPAWTGVFCLLMNEGKYEEAVKLTSEATELSWAASSAMACARACILKRGPKAIVEQIK